MASNALSSTQQKALLSISDALIPSLSQGEIEQAKSEITATVVNPEWKKIKEFLEQSSSSTPRFPGEVFAFVAGLPSKAVQDLGGFLDVLNNGGEACLAMTGTAASFPELERAQRTAILQAWSKSEHPQLAGVFCSLKRLIMTCYLRVSKAAFEAMEYPDPSQQKSNEDGANGAGSSPSFDFFQIPKNAQDYSTDADIIIIGTGAGSGVVTAKLAEKYKGAKKILVLEKGDYVPPSEMPVPPSQTNRVYDGGVGAFITADDKGIILAGGSWGGGTVVNFSGSLEPPASVRTEWADVHGLSFVASPEFQDSLNRISKRLGVSTNNLKHNIPNRMLKDGAKRLGLQAHDMPQNSHEKDHDCGLCAYGCPTSTKQSSTVSWFVDAQQHGGVTYVKNCAVQRVILGDNGQAEGVEAVVNGTCQLKVKATTVVVGAGAIRTPCILQNSGVKNPMLGKNLRVQPQIFVLSYCHKAETKPWDGTIMSAHVNCANEKYPDYPTKLFMMGAYPAMTNFMNQWEEPMAWKVEVLKAKQAIWLSVCLRDMESSGTVTVDPNSPDPTVLYTLADADKDARIDAVITACKLFIGAGVDEVHPTIHNGDKPSRSYVVPPNRNYLDDPAWHDFVAYIKEVRCGDSWTSGHPMGTCRMGKDKESSVVDATGNVWGSPGLWVADASLCPSATAANPQMTVMALADRVGECIIKSLD